MPPLSNGNSFANGSSYGSGGRRNTEPWYWRMVAGVQPGAVS